MEEGSLIGLVIVIIIFVVCRELICWYWKLNDIVILMKEIHEELIIIRKSTIKIDER